MVMSNWREKENKFFSISTPGLDQAVKRAMNALIGMEQVHKSHALRRALEKSVNVAKQDARNVAQKTYTATPKKLFENMDIGYHSDDDGQEGVLEFTGSWGLHLYHFEPLPAIPGRRPRGGVTTKVHQKGRRYAKELDGFDAPFIMRRKQGDYGLFAHVTGTGWGSVRGAARQETKNLWKNSVTMLWGPSPIQALMPEKTQQRIIDHASGVFTKNMRREVEALLASLAKG